FLAVREDQIAAEAMGVDTTKYKVKAFIIGSFLAGCAGGLFAHYMMYLNPTMFMFIKSFEVVAMVVLGGLGSISGSIIAAINVTIRFGGLTAVADFKLDVKPHELIGLIGPNGAGKTTVFNMLTGVYKPTEGTIEVAGVPTAELKPFDITALGVARTFQNIRLFKDLTVLDNVKIGGHIHYKYSATSGVLHTNRFQEAERVAEEDA